MADQTSAGALPDAELQILRHALGVGDGGLERSYRSHFVTGPGGTDHQHCMALVERGFMVRRAGIALTGGSDLFNVTQAGRAAVQEHTPPRWRDVRRISAGLAMRAITTNTSAPMADQLLLFPIVTFDVEDAIQKILTLRRKYCCSGHAGEDIELIRAALMKEPPHG